MWLCYQNSQVLLLSLVSNIFLFPISRAEIFPSVEESSQNHLFIELFGRKVVSSLLESHSPLSAGESPICCPGHFSRSQMLWFLLSPQSSRPGSEFIHACTGVSDPPLMENVFILRTSVLLFSQQRGEKTCSAELLWRLEMVDMPGS